MKKLLTLVAALITGLAISVKAGTATYTIQSFINNGTYVCLTNGLAFTNNSIATPSGVGYATNVWWYPYTIGTNVLALSTNSIGNTIPFPFVDVPLFPDGNADVNTNLELVATIGITNAYPRMANQTPVVMNTVWTNPASFFTSSTIPGTNTLTLTFAPVSDTQANLADTSAGRQFTWTIPLAGLTLPVTLSTTVSASSVLGACKLRLYSVAISGNATAGSLGVTLDGLWLEGWSP